MKQSKAKENCTSGLQKNSLFTFGPSVPLCFPCTNTRVYCVCVVNWIQGSIYLKYDRVKNPETSEQSLLRSSCCWKVVHQAASSVVTEQIKRTIFILQSYNYQMNLITLRDLNFVMQILAI